jgi:hypothetical protein
MNLVTRKLRILVSTVALVVVSTTAGASFIEGDFDGTAGGLGNYSGMFSGDTGSDNVLSLDEVSAFSITFSGPTTNNIAVTIDGVDTLTRFEFDVSTDSFLAGPDVYQSYLDTTQPYFIVPGPPYPGALALGTYIWFTSRDDLLDDGNAVDNLAITSKAPEPAILALFGFGLAGIGAARVKKLTAKCPSDHSYRRGIA